jgi:Cellulase (glycosyl hydrolase family 5)
MKLFDVYRFNAFIPRAGRRRLAVMSLLASIAGNMAIQAASADELPVVTFKAEPTTVSKGGYATLSWSSKYADKCLAYGPWSGSEGVKGSSTTNGLTETTTFVLTCFNPLGEKTSAKATVKVDSSEPAATKGAVQRPSYNTGTGFFVYDGKLYDANGNAFRIRGVNRCHFDSDSQPGISNSKANTVRMFMYELSIGAAKYAEVVQTEHIDYHEVPVLSMPMFPDNSLTSGNQSTSELSAAVNWWVANAKTFKPLEKYLIINIANEWGPSNSTVWRDAYISAVGKLRAAGYRGPLLIDSGGYGQDPHDILNYGAAVFNSDPQKNVIFSYHDYSPVSSLAYFPEFAALASQGIPVIIGEFGPGKDIGPSPTTLTPGQVITTAEANGLGWIAWAWDDNDMGNGKSDNKWFSMTYAGPGIYTSAASLTDYGLEVVLDSTYGLSALAKPASIFE